MLLLPLRLVSLSLSVKTMASMDSTMYRYAAHQRPQWNYCQMGILSRVAFHPGFTVIPPVPHSLEPWRQHQTALPIAFIHIQRMEVTSITWMELWVTPITLVGCFQLSLVKHIRFRFGCTIEALAPIVMSKLSSVYSITRKADFKTSSKAIDKCPSQPSQSYSFRAR